MNLNLISCPAPDIQHVLIWKADRFHAGILRHAVESILPSASIQIVRQISGADAAVATGPVDLLLTGIGSVQGDVLDFLFENLVSRRRLQKVLVVTGLQDQHTLAVLRNLSIAGVFDTASEDSEQFERALSSVASGSGYWSPSVLARVATECLPPQSLCRRLTPAEQLVLAMIGDGCDDNVAAERLQLKSSTMSSVRRALHRKLGVQHRGELIQMAAQHGFIRFTPDGVVRPGYASMMAAWQSRRKKSDVYSANPAASTTDRVAESSFKY